MWDPLNEFSHAIFPNGLELHSAHWPNRPWQMVVFVVHSGSDADPFGAEGSAHFVEHLLSESSGFDRKKIDATFDQVGGSVSLGNTGYASTLFIFFGPADQNFLIKSFNLFGKMLFKNALDGHFESNRTIVLAEFDNYFEVEHKYHLTLLERQSLYPNYFRSRFVAPFGLRESVEKITPDDLKSFYEKNYVPKNVSVVSVGGMKIHQLMDCVFKSSLEEEKPGVRNPKLAPREGFEPPENNFRTFSFSQYYGTAEEGLMNGAGYRSVTLIPGQSKRWAVFFLKEMIGQILHQEVRENKSWTYSMTARNYYLGDVQELAIDCTALSLNALEEIESTVTDCFNQIGNSRELFERLKEKTLSRLKMIDVSGASLCRQAAEHLSSIRRIPSYGEWISEIKSVTLEEIVELTRWTTPEMRWTLIKKP